ncbi:MAG: cell division protein ZapA [Acidobacteriota bacterium]
MSDVVVPVEILGQRYPIGGGLDAAYIQQLASFVDEKMRAAVGQTSESDSARLAVIAALNIADEVFRLKAPADARDAALAARLRRLEDLIDAALAD